MEIKLTKKQAWPLVGKLFPDYTGRKFVMQFVERIVFRNLNWDGGSRNEYKFVRSDGKLAVMPVLAPWKEVNEGRTVELPPEVLVVEHTFFCGRDLGIRIYANPVHAPKWLSSGKEVNR